MCRQDFFILYAPVHAFSVIRTLKSCVGRWSLFSIHKATSHTDLFRRYNIRHFSTNGKPKAAIVERFIRTLRGLLFRYMTENLTDTYIDVLEKLVDNYNNTKHQTIGMAPNDVKPENEDAVFRKLYPEMWEMKRTELRKSVKPSFVVGDIVKKSLRHRSAFSKSLARIQ